MIHCEECASPEHQDQRRVEPVAARHDVVTAPVGAADVAMQAALFSLQTSCCASSGNSASMQA